MAIVKIQNTQQKPDKFVQIFNQRKKLKKCVKKLILKKKNYIKQTFETWSNFSKSENLKEIKSQSRSYIYLNNLIKIQQRIDLISKIKAFDKFQNKGKNEKFESQNKS